MNRTVVAFFTITTLSAGCGELTLVPFRQGGSSGGQGGIGDAGGTAGTTATTSTAGVGGTGGMADGVTDCGGNLHEVEPFDLGPMSQDTFGWAIAASEDTLVVGRGQNSTPGDQGWVKVYACKDGKCDKPPQVLTPPPALATPSEAFGYSVSVSGDTMVIGAPFHRIEMFLDDITINECGAAYIFTRKNGVWGPTGYQLLASDAREFDHFGAAVSVSGKLVVIGAPHGHDNTSTGSAYLFKPSGNDWEEVQKFVPKAGLLNGDTFGSSVASLGNTVVIGAPSSSAIKKKCGAPFVFTIDGATVTEQLLPFSKDDLLGGDGLATSVAISGDTIAVGTGGQSSNKSVFVFAWEAGKWVRQTRVACSASSGKTSTGQFVALGGDTLAVSGTRVDSDGILLGAVQLFSRKIGVWSEIVELGAHDGAAFDRFGSSFALTGGGLSGPAIWIGASRSAQNGKLAGSVYEVGPIRDIAKQ